MFLSSLAIGCGAFLLAVLWMDLMFDVQVRRDGKRGDVSAEVLASVAAYYRRVTTDARPMSHVIGIAMLTAIASLVIQFARGDVPHWLSLASLALIVPPVTIAATRTVPNAIRLGTRTNSPLDQSRLARSILADHLFCLGAILAFLALRLWALFP